MRRPPALALALSAGCGLASSGPALDPVPSDGVSGFGEATPVEICLGPALVIPPEAASGAGALCVPEGATARPCDGDGACAGIERCVCGRCVVRACAGGVGCEAGEVCRGDRCTRGCATDGACAAGERCVSGGCARRCGGDADCHHGERCDALDGACRADGCAGPGSCGPGATCEPVALRLEVREPEILDDGGGAIAFVELRGAGLPGAPGAAAAIYRARVEAARRWVIDPPSPALAPPAGEDRIGAPAALLREGAIDLYAELGGGAAIVRATSADGGATFALDAAPVLTPSAAWEAGRVGSPSVVALGGATWLFYEGGAAAGVGVASVASAGRGAAERASDAPAIAPADVEDPLLWRAVTRVGAPEALVVGDVVRVYFTARGAEGGDAVSSGEVIPAPANDSIGLATTRDLASYSLYPTGPVFSRVTNLRSYLGEREAAVRLAPAGAEITFVATDPSGEKVIGLSAAGAAAADMAAEN